VSAFLKNVWAKEPVLGASFRHCGPYTKYSLRTNRATPYNHLEWLKRL
ncbi:hypothetical protein FD755_006432, partial [Muntiacus reevesi]